MRVAVQDCRAVDRRPAGNDKDVDHKWVRVQCSSSNVSFRSVGRLEKKVAEASFVWGRLLTGDSIRFRVSLTGAMAYRENIDRVLTEEE